MTSAGPSAIVATGRSGISSRAYSPGPYAELESMIAAWDREYLKALGE